MGVMKIAFLSGVSAIGKNNWGRKHLSIHLPIQLSIIFFVSAFLFFSLCINLLISVHLSVNVFMYFRIGPLYKIIIYLRWLNLYVSKILTFFWEMLFYLYARCLLVQICQPDKPGMCKECLLNIVSLKLCCNHVRHISLTKPLPLLFRDILCLPINCLGFPIKPFTRERERERERERKSGSRLVCTHLQFDVIFFKNEFF